MATKAKRTCGSCGASGHNARTCPGKARSAPANVSKRPAAATPAPGTPAAEEPGLVIDQLEMRAAALRAQISSVEKLKRELSLIEALIGDLRKLEGAA